MLNNIIASNVNCSDQCANFRINAPSTCPHCGFAVSPLILSSHYVVLKESYYEDNNQYRIFVKFMCNNCLKAFDSEYSYNHSLTDSFKYALNLDVTYPVFHAEPTHSDEIKELSERFVQIYNQSHFAEESTLCEICGMGYRKALEFLIKDYVIKIHPDSEEEIKNTMLGPCIKKYIDNNRIKTLATASTWLGNDETHYCRKHKDYDLESLKSFIHATESFINSEMEAIKAEELIKSSH